MKMNIFCNVLFVGLFMFIHGHPLDNEQSAFDYIDNANSELPDAIQSMLEEGDIMKPPGAAVDKKYGQWPNGVVPYTISSSFGSSEKSKIRNALEDIMDAAPCMRFQEYTYRSSNVPTAHIEVIKSGGCWSMVGKTGGKQSLSLGNGCVYTGTIIHEFLHAIGFYHEQSRPDRDQYVQVNWNNVAGGREHNFKIAKNINSLGVAYDEVSVMHYSNGAFSNGNGPTLVWKANKGQRLGGRVLSEKDILQINLKYCGGPTSPPTTTTKKPTTTTTTKKPTTTTEKVTKTTKQPTTTEKMTTTPTTVQPGGQVCGDNSGYCIAVQSRRRPCNSWQMKKCPRTCQVCTGPESEKCLNFEDKSDDCMAMAEAGECQNRNSSIRWAMKNKCPRVCCERGELYKSPKY